MRAWKVMAGPKSTFAENCFTEGFVGVDYGVEGDLTDSLSQGEASFRARWRDDLMNQSSGRSAQSAAVRAGQVWLLSAAVLNGDVVVTPTGNPSVFRIGVVTSGYSYVPGGVLPHRRSVEWLAQAFDAAVLSAPLPRFGASICALDGHLQDLQRIIAAIRAGTPFAGADEGSVSPYEFATEKYLEDFLVKNWAATEFGRTHEIYTVDGEVVGQQFPTSMGPIDILAQSKDGMEFLVVELKRGKTSDRVVGQVLRYMGAVATEIAGTDQRVRGIIIGAAGDARIEAALRFAPDVGFRRYQIRFDLESLE